MEAKQVLIVEDEIPVQHLVRRMLEEHKAVVTAVSSGDAATDILKDKKIHYDLVILDLILPEITGWDVLDALKEHPKTKDTPIIIFTGASLSEKEKEKMLQKANVIVEKNMFTFQVFDQILTKWL